MYFYTRCNVYSDCLQKKTEKSIGEYVCYCTQICKYILLYYIKLHTPKNNSQHCQNYQLYFWEYFNLIIYSTFFFVRDVYMLLYVCNKKLINYKKLHKCFTLKTSINCLKYNGTRHDIVRLLVLSTCKEKQIIYILIPKTVPQNDCQNLIITLYQH